MIDITCAYRIARRQARRVVPRAMRHWRADVAQEVMASFVVAHARFGAPPTAFWGRRYAVSAARRIFGGVSNRWRRSRELHAWMAREPAVDAPHELAALCAWRARVAWTAMAPHQRAALVHVVYSVDKSDAARIFGVCDAGNNFARSLQRALGRIDSPPGALKPTCNIPRRAV